MLHILVPTPISCGTRAVDLPDTRQLVLCPANCTLWTLSVFGSGVYASISSICGAAIHRYNRRRNEKDMLDLCKKFQKQRKFLCVIQRNHKSIWWTCGGSRTAREDELPQLLRSWCPVSVAVTMELIFHCGQWVETIMIWVITNACVCFDLKFV